MRLRSPAPRANSKSRRSVSSVSVQRQSLAPLGVVAEEVAQMQALDLPAMLRQGLPFGALGEGDSAHARNSRSDPGTPVERGLYFLDSLLKNPLRGHRGGGM